MQHDDRDFRTHRFNNIVYRSLYVKKTNDIENTILYIGGAFQSLEDIYLVKKHLAEFGNLILLELPGFGKSDRLPEDYSLDFYAQCIYSALSSYNAKEVIGYGYSYGVGPMLKASSKYSELFKAVIFASACASFTDKMIDDMKHLIWVASNDPKLFPSTFENVLCHPNKNELTNGRASALLLRRMLRSQTSDSLARFSDNYKRLLKEHQAVDVTPVPALLLIGEHDSYVSSNRLKEFKPFCKTIEINVIKGCDHFFHLQDKEADKPLIENFIKTIHINQCIDLIDQFLNEI